MGRDLQVLADEFCKKVSQLIVPCDDEAPKATQERVQSGEVESLSTNATTNSLPTSVLALLVAGSCVFENIEMHAQSACRDKLLICQLMLRFLCKAHPRAGATAATLTHGSDIISRRTAFDSFPYASYDFRSPR